MPNPTVAALSARAITAPARLGATRLVLVDGQAGAGKSTLAARIAESLSAPLLHTDDMLAGWDGLPGLGDTVAALLAPLARGEAGAYRRWDWEAEDFAEEVTVEPGEFLVIEGVGAAARGVREHASIVVLVEAPWETRLARGLERDAGVYPDAEARWTRWNEDEAAHHAAEGTRAAADVVIDGTAPVADR